MANNFGLHIDVDIYQKPTCWMATFIMGHCNSRSSDEHFHGIRKHYDWLLNMVSHQMAWYLLSVMNRQLFCLRIPWKLKVVMIITVNWNILIEPKSGTLNAIKNKLEAKKHVEIMTDWMCRWSALPQDTSWNKDSIFKLPDVWCTCYAQHIGVMRHWHQFNSTGFFLGIVSCAYVSWSCNHFVLPTTQPNAAQWAGPLVLYSLQNTYSNIDIYLIIIIMTCS